MPLRVATRGSALARWQAEHVAALLRAADGAVEVELVLIETSGDRDRERPIWEIAGQGVFVKEVQQAVIDGRADLAVHSAKDLPSSPDLLPAELVLAAVPGRGDPRDALVGGRLADLPPGAVVATGSSRRRAQLADLRPDLSFTSLRGNIGTRLERAGDHGAIVVAAAALDRLGLSDRAAEVLPAWQLLPQVGQGALAVECRADDDELRRRLAGIEHGPSRRAVDAERGFLARLGGGCELPAAAHAEVSGDGALRLRALLASSDGRCVLRVEAAGAPGDEPGAVGAELAHHLLDQRGGSWLLGQLRGAPLQH